MERWKLTLKAINELKPTVVFLDGLIDVVGDFNDNKECQAIDSMITQSVGNSSPFFEKSSKFSENVL